VINRVTGEVDGEAIAAGLRIEGDPADRDWKRGAGACGTHGYTVARSGNLKHYEAKNDEAKV